MIFCRIIFEFEVIRECVFIKLEDICEMIDMFKFVEDVKIKILVKFDGDIKV